MTIKIAFLVLGIAIVLWSAVVIIWAPGGRITKANFDKIEIGMTFSDVNRILCCAPGDYTAGRSVFRPASQARVWQGGRTETWFGTSVSIHLDFDSHDKVIVRHVHNAKMMSWAERIKKAIDF